MGTVFDESIRLALQIPEIQKKRVVNISFDYQATGMLKLFLNLVPTTSSELVATLDKLSMYSEGECSNNHRYTYRDENYFGSLTAFLLVAFLGRK